MAVGRIVLGAASLVAPHRLSTLFGVPASGEVVYLTRIFGARAIALGMAYLAADDEHRDRLQRLSFGVDISDTVTGLGHVARRDVPSRAIGPMVALTGTYAALGAEALLAGRTATPATEGSGPTPSVEGQPLRRAGTRC